MPQYIVFRRTEETDRLKYGDLRAYYEAAIVGYFNGTQGKKKQSIQDVATLLGADPQASNLVPTIKRGGDSRTAIALSKGDITTIYGINAQDALDVFPSPEERPPDADWVQPDDA